MQDAVLEEGLMNAIVVKDLHKQYGGKAAVDGVSFDVREGEIFGLVGPNGAGKTTIMEILLGLRDADGGQFSVLGQSGAKRGSAYKHRVGAQLQEAMLPANLKTWEAVDLQAAYFGRTVDVDAELKRYGLEKSRNVAFSRLSGGQRQRLFVLLSVLHDPELVFLDELSTGLDPESRRDAWSEILGLKRRGKTVILVTHYMDEAQQLCDRVLFLFGGKVAALGSPADLIGGLGFKTVVRFKPLSGSIPDLAGLGVSPDVDEFGYVELRGNDRALEDGVRSALDRAAVGYADLSSRQASLEDVFHREAEREVVA